MTNQPTHDPKPDRADRTGPGAAVDQLPPISDILKLLEQLHEAGVSEEIRVMARRSPAHRTLVQSAIIEFGLDTDEKFDAGVSEIPISFLNFFATTIQLFHGELSVPVREKLAPFAEVVLTQLTRLFHEDRYDDDGCELVTGLIRGVNQLVGDCSPIPGTLREAAVFAATEGFAELRNVDESYVETGRLETLEELSRLTQNLNLGEFYDAHVEVANRIAQYLGLDITIPIGNEVEKFDRIKRPLPELEQVFEQVLCTLGILQQDLSLIQTWRELMHRCPAASEWFAAPIMGLARADIVELDPLLPDIIDGALEGDPRTLTVVGHLFEVPIAASNIAQAAKAKGQLGKLVEVMDVAVSGDELILSAFALGRLEALKGTVAEA